MNEKGSERTFDSVSNKKKHRIKTKVWLPIWDSVLEASDEIGVDDPRSPAGKAGLKTGDVITHVGGVEIPDYPALQTALRQKQASLSITYERDGASAQVNLVPNAGWRPVGAVERSQV